MINFLESSIKRLQYYKELGDKTFIRLTDSDFYFCPAADCNSIGVIIQHLHGNMVSRWTDFLTTDGEKPSRERDQEFVEHSLTKARLLVLWEIGWDCFLTALKNLDNNDLEKIIEIRSEPMTVVDAINRQLAHYPYHVGQIVYIARMIKKEDWESLSIPRKRN